MDPEMIRLAQEQMSRIPPDDLLRMQQQMFSNPDLFRMASEGMKNMRPEDFRFAAEQMRNLAPESIADMSARMANVTPEQLSSMNSFSGAQENYEFQGALMLKNQGNQLHGSGNYQEAIEKYQKAKENVARLTSSDASKLWLTCSSNLMSCYLKIGQYEKAISEGTEVLASDSRNLKALYRRGQAYKELGKYKEAVSDLSQAAEISPDDETVANVLCQAKKELEAATPAVTKEQDLEEPASTDRDGPIIEEITEEEAERLTSSSQQERNEVRQEASPTPTVVPGPPQEPSTSTLPGMYPPGDQTYAEALHTMQSNPQLLRSMHSMVSSMDPAQLANLSGGRMTPEMAKMGADMMKNMSASDLERMVQMAGSMQQSPPSATRFPSSVAPEVAQNLQQDVAPSSTNTGTTLGMPQMQMDPEQIAALSGGKMTPEMARLGSDMMKNMSPSDLERMMGMARSMQAASSGSGAATSSSGGVGMPAGLQAQMRDPAMKEMMVSMMKSMTPESMASMSEQMGMKLSPDQAAELQKSMSQLTPEQLDTMMRWAERAQVAAEQARRAKAWILGKPGLILAIFMLLVAVILHYFGFIGR